jgi:hypothetical protein
MTAEPKIISYDESSVELLVKLPCDRVERARSRRRINKALRKAFAAFVVTANRHLPEGCVVMIDNNEVTRT